MKYGIEGKPSSLLNTYSNLFTFSSNGYKIIGCESIKSMIKETSGTMCQC